jgi:succinyl-CoA synthetase beta subunit
MTLVTPQTGPEGKLVRKLLIQRDMYYADSEGRFDVKEYYMSILLNRKTGRNIIMYSTEGGG